MAIRNLKYLLGESGEIHTAFSNGSKVLLECKYLKDVQHTLTATDWKFTSESATCPDCIANAESLVGAL